MQGNGKHRKRGPKPFAPKAHQRRLVTLLAAGGLSEPGIAREIGICQNTLRKHFAAELTEAHEREMAENLKRLRKAADRGNVTAMKHLDAKLGAVSAAAAWSGQPTAEPKPEKLGKKQIAEAAALTAGEGSGWGDDLRIPDTPMN